MEIDQRKEKTHCIVVTSHEHVSAISAYKFQFDWFAMFYHIKFLKQEQSSAIYDMTRAALFFFKIKDLYKTRLLHPEECTQPIKSIQEQGSSHYIALFVRLVFQPAAYAVSHDLFQLFWWEHARWWQLGVGLLQGWSHRPNLPVLLSWAEGGQVPSCSFCSTLDVLSTQSAVFLV